VFPVYISQIRLLSLCCGYYEKCSAVGFIYSYDMTIGKLVLYVLIFNILSICAEGTPNEPEIEIILTHL